MENEMIETPPPAGPVIQYRNMWVQVLLMIVTFGFYAVYWYYVTCNELANSVRREEEPVSLWTILLFVPPLCLYSYYKQGELFERVSPDINRWLLFALWLFFAPAVWFLVQLKLNRLAR